MPSSEPEDRGLVKVVLVDDSPHALRRIKRFLADHAEIDVVGEALTIETGLALVAAAQPDVVILDRTLPDGCGITAIPQLRLACPSLAIVVLSAGDDPDDVEQAREAGAVAYVTKDRLGSALIPAVMYASGRGPSPESTPMGADGVEALLARFFYLSPDRLAIVGFDGRLKAINVLMDGDPAQALGRDVIELTAPELRASAETALGVLRSGVTPPPFEVEKFLPDGTVRHTSWRAVPDPVSGVIFAVGRDVTAERGALLALDQIQEVVFRTDAAGRLTYANRAIVDVLGVPAAAATGTALVDRVHPADRAAFAAGWDALVQGERARWTAEFGRADSAGRVELRVQRISGTGGTFCGASGTILDVTEQRGAEAVFRGLIDASSDAIGVTVDGRIDYVNRRWLDRFGHDRLEDVRGRLVADVLHPDHRDRYEVTTTAVSWRGHPSAVIVVRDVR